MMRFIMPIILIAISVTVFFTFTEPLYTDITMLRSTMASYNEALDNSKALESERDKLTAKYNSIDPLNLTKIAKMVPENIDNIRLILEIERIASPYGMALKDIKYSTAPIADISNAGPRTAAVAGRLSLKDYGVWDLEFSTAGSYNNFINFTKDLETNLRIADISSVTFTSGDSRAGATSDVYQYNFKIKTYWLKN